MIVGPSSAIPRARTAILQSYFIFQAQDLVDTAMKVPRFLKGLVNRKKGKRPLSSTSEYPLPSQPPSRALTPNPSSFPSGSSPAATEPSAVTSKVHGAPSDHSVARTTALNVFKLSLSALSAASNNVPVPGLKLAMEGLLKAIEKVQVVREHLKEVTIH